MLLQISTVPSVLNESTTKTSSAQRTLSRQAAMLASSLQVRTRTLTGAFLSYAVIGQASRVCGWQRLPGSRNMPLRSHARRARSMKICDGLPVALFRQAWREANSLLPMQAIDPPDVQGSAG